MISLYAFRNCLLIKSLKLECQDWTANSFRVGVFSRLLTRSGPVVGHYPGKIETHLSMYLL